MSNDDRLGWYEFNPASPLAQTHNPNTAQVISGGDRVLLSSKQAEVILAQFAGADGAPCLTPSVCPGWAPMASQEAEAAMRGWDGVGEPSKIEHLAWTRGAWRFSLYTAPLGFRAWLTGPVGPEGRMSVARKLQLGCPIPADGEALMPIEAFLAFNEVIDAHGADVSNVNSLQMRQPEGEGETPEG